MTELLRQLIATPSFPREEKAACDLLEQWMQAHGLQPLRKGNNLMLQADCNGGEPTDGDRRKPLLLLNAHIDTVRPAASYTRDPFSPDIEGDRLYGLGSNDDGGSLIALLKVYCHLAATRQPYRLCFTATAEEEVSGRGGVEMLLPDLGAVSLGIIGEPTRMQMAVAEKGLMVLDCTAHGKSGHAARNEGVNALYEALPDIERLRTWRFPKVSPYLGEVKTSVTMIQAGTQHNVVPDSCTFVADVRSNGMYTNAELLDLIRGELRCDVTARSTRLNASHIEENHPAVMRARELGIPLVGSPTTSNQSVLPFPTVKIGPGDSARSHTADEYICLSEIAAGIDTYIRLLDGLNIQTL